MKTLTSPRRKKHLTAGRIARFYAEDDSALKNDEMRRKLAAFKRLTRQICQDAAVNPLPPEFYEILVKNDWLAVVKPHGKKHLTTAERIAKFYAENARTKNSAVREVDWGKPTGQEIW